MFAITILIFTAIVVPYTIYYFKRYRITPATIFLLMQMNMFYGICMAPKGQTAIALKLEMIYPVACLCFILGIELAVKIGKKKSGAGVYLNGSDFIDRDPSTQQMVMLWIIIIVSLLACTYFFVAGGINVFLRSLQDFFSGSAEDYSNEREQYFSVKGTGYIYQFRAILLPILATFLVFGLKRKKHKFFFWMIFALMVVFLLGTGQRNAFVFYIAIVLAYIYMLKSYYNIRIMKKSQMVILGLSAVLFMIVLTIGNGRVASEGNSVSAAILSIIERLFAVNQRTAIVAFEYINAQPTVWGYDWLMMMADILPGKSGYLSVDRIVYYIAYGTYSGTGPPDLWTSAWYNFKYLGITVFPFFMGMMYHFCYQKMTRKINKNRLYILIYAALCIYLGIWCYGTPMTLFNNGVVSIIILRWVMFTVAPTKLHRYRKLSEQTVSVNTQFVKRRY